MKIICLFDGFLKFDIRFVLLKSLSLGDFFYSFSNIAMCKVHLAFRFGFENLIEFINMLSFLFFGHTCKTRGANFAIVYQHLYLKFFLNRHLFFLLNIVYLKDVVSLNIEFENMPKNTFS